MDSKQIDTNGQWRWKILRFWGAGLITNACGADGGISDPNRETMIFWFRASETDSGARSVTVATFHRYKTIHQ